MEGGDDDIRQYRCFSKYQEIVKQVLFLDELTDSINPQSNTRLSKLKMIKQKGGSSSSANNGTVVLTNNDQQESFDQVMVQTITRFLSDLNSKTVHKSSTSDQ